MDGKAVNTLVIIGAIAIALMLVMRTKKTTVAATGTTAGAAKAGSSTWSSVGSFLGGLGSSLIGNWGTSSKGTSDSGEYTWQGYDDSTVDLG